MERSVIWSYQQGNPLKYAQLGVNGNNTQIQLGIITELSNGTFRVESSYASSQPTFSTLGEVEKYLLQIAGEHIL